MIVWATVINTPAWSDVQQSFFDPQIALQALPRVWDGFLLNLQVLVGTPPTFTGTVAAPGSCVGTPVCLDGQVNATTWSAQPTANFGAGVFLPDDVGSCFTSDLLFSGFAPGATLTIPLANEGRFSLSASATASLNGQTAAGSSEALVVIVDRTPPQAIVLDPAEDKPLAIGLLPSGRPLILSGSDQREGKKQEKSKMLHHESIVT